MPAPAAPAALSLTQAVVHQESQRQAQAAAAAKARQQTVQQEYCRLQQLHEAVQREHHAIVDQLRTELAAKSALVSELQVALDRLMAERAAHDTELAGAVAKCEARAHTAAAAEGRRHCAQVEALQERLSAIEGHREQQADAEATVTSLRAEVASLRTALEEQRINFGHESKVQAARAHMECEQRLEALQQAQDAALEERMDAAVRRTLAANRCMSEELRLHEQEGEALGAQLALVEAERRRLLHELALKEEMEVGFARRGAKQKVALREQTERVVGLEAALQQIVECASADRAALASSAAASVRDARSEADTLRRLVRLKAREARCVRALAQEVLLQRSDVEIFLLAALQQVKAELAREADTAAAAAGDPAGIITADAAEGHQQEGSDTLAGRANMTGVVPAAAASSTGLSPASGVGAASSAAREDVPQAIDSGALSWTDRDRVLRVLFSKIQSQRAQMHYANLPAHSIPKQPRSVALAVLQE